MTWGRDSFVVQDGFLMILERMLLIPITIVVIQARVLLTWAIRHRTFMIWDRIRMTSG